MICSARAYLCIRVNFSTRPRTNLANVRRQVFWHQWGLELRKSSAHLIDFVVLRAGGDASAAFRVFSCF